MYGSTIIFSSRRPAVRNEPRIIYKSNNRIGTTRYTITVYYARFPLDKYSNTYKNIVCQSDSALDRGRHRATRVVFAVVEFCCSQETLPNIAIAIYYIIHYKCIRTPGTCTRVYTIIIIILLLLRRIRVHSHIFYAYFRRKRAVLL